MSSLPNKKLARVKESATLAAMKAKDPIVKISAALAKTGGNKAELARQLGIKRAWMCELAGTKETLPPLYAHRFVSIYGRKSADGFEHVE